MTFTGKTPGSVRRGIRWSRPMAVVSLIATPWIGGLIAQATAGAAARSLNPPTVTTITVTSLGTVLATPRHFVLYTFSHDRRNVSLCMGTCAKTWPPYLLASGQVTLHAPKNLRGLGTTHRGKRLQVTIDGHPLYLFVGDHRVGQASGEGFDNEWFAVGPNGHRDLLSRSSPTAGSGKGTSPASSGPAGYALAPTTTTPAATAPPPTAPPTTTTAPPMTTTAPPTTIAPPTTTTSPPTTTTAPPMTTTTPCSIPQGNGGDGDGDNNGGASDGDGCK